MTSMKKLKGGCNKYLKEFENKKGTIYTQCCDVELCNECKAKITEHESVMKDVEKFINKINDEILDLSILEENKDLTVSQAIEDSLDIIRINAKETLNK